MSSEILAYTQSTRGNRYTTSGIERAASGGAIGDRNPKGEHEPGASRNAAVIRPALFGASGLTLGILAAAGLLIIAAASLAGIMWLSADSSTAHAKNVIQASFVNGRGRSTADVQSCKEVSSDFESRIFRCEIAAATCQRSFLFDVPRDYWYGMEPANVTEDVYSRPCSFASDPAYARLVKQR